MHYCAVPSSLLMLGEGRMLNWNSRLVNVSWRFLTSCIAHVKHRCNVSCKGHLFSMSKIPQLLLLPKPVCPLATNCRFNVPGRLTMSSMAFCSAAATSSPGI